MPCECLLLTRLLMFVDRDGNTPLHMLMRNQSLTPELMKAINDIVPDAAWAVVDS